MSQSVQVVATALDIMHVEKNIVEFVLRFMFGDEDTPKYVKEDLEVMRMRRKLWLILGRNKHTFTKPRAPYVLLAAEKKIFIVEVSAIRTPTRYGSSLEKHLSKSKFMGLKPHDYHCLIQQIILAISITLLQPLERTTLIQLEKRLNRICARVVDRANLAALRMYVVETLCYLELYFPPFVLTLWSTLSDTFG